MSSLTYASIAAAAGSIFPVNFAHRLTSSAHTIKRRRTSCFDNCDFPVRLSDLLLTTAAISSPVLIPDNNRIFLATVLTRVLV